MTSVSDALNGRTVRLGALLASAGVSTIVVMNSSAPALAGVQSAPIRDAPGVLDTALNDQSDLSLVLQTPSVEVFSNSLFHGIVAQTVPGTSKILPLFSTTSNTGALFSGSTVEAGYAPASAFALSVNGRGAPHSTDGSWLSYFQVPTSTSNLTGTLSLQRFPFNAILAFVTLAVWVLVWLGFGWIQRVEWLFTGRRRRERIRSER
jgi:hypothetical protein